ADARDDSSGAGASSPAGPLSMDGTTSFTDCAGGGLSGLFSGLFSGGGFAPPVLARGVWLIRPRGRPQRAFPVLEKGLNPDLPAAFRSVACDLDGQRKGHRSFIESGFDTEVLVEGCLGRRRLQLAREPKRLFGGQGEARRPWAPGRLIGRIEMPT